MFETRHRLYQLNYDYMGLEPDSSVGATQVSKAAMESRASAEFEKLIKAQVPKTGGYSKLSSEIFVDVFNFTPARS